MKVRAHRITGDEITVPGDLLKIKENQKLIPIIMMIGYKVKDIEKVAGSELEGIYRPAEEVKQ